MTPPSLRLALWLWVALVFNCKSGDSLTPVERGRRTFMRNCASCHGANGKGLPLPGYTVPPTDLTSEQFRSTRDTTAIRSVLLNGKGSMPPLGKLLSESELDELIAYVETLGGS